MTVTLERYDAREAIVVNEVQEKGAAQHQSFESAMIVMEREIVPRYGPDKSGQSETVSAVL